MQTRLRFLKIPFNSKNLFSRHFLEQILRRSPIWDKATQDADKTLEQLKGLLAKKCKTVAKLSEPQLEEDFIRPILRILGHIYDVQAPILYAFGTFGKPDYAIFPDERTRNRAREEKGEEKYFKNTIAVGEAKRWDEDLDRRGKARKRERRIIPSSQINTYLRVSGVRWGILTNGRLWRLYYKETSFNLDSYYEIDLPLLIQHGTVEQFKYFYLFFRREAFIRAPSGRCFLDEVYDKSIDFAKELEESVKENVYETLSMKL